VKLRDLFNFMWLARMKKIITYGTFDVIHSGHINLLKRARELGDELYVGLSSDSFNLMKHKQSLLDFYNRKIILEAIRYVDFVFAEEDWEQKKEDIDRYDIDTLVMGNDWDGKFDFLKPCCNVVYLPRTPNISTTILKNKKLAIF